MKAVLQKSGRSNEFFTSALECDFPNVEVSKIAEQESWRKEVNRPLYHIHKWWATRLGSVFRAITLAALTPKTSKTWSSFYQQHDFKGKVVLDPFMGSGTTVGEALKLGANAVGCDINPVSTFLVRQSLTRVSESKLREEFAKLESRVAPAIRHFYQTKDPDTGNTIPVLYFFWVKTVETPEGETIPLFSSYVFSKDAYPNKKPKAQIVCPECWAVFEARFDSVDVACPSCSNCFNPQEGRASGQRVSSKSGVYRIKDLLPKDGTPPKHRLYALLALRENGEKVYLKPTVEDQGLYMEAEKRLSQENLLLPTLEIREGHNTDQARGYNYHHWSDFFNPRQLLCLGFLLKEILTISDVTIQEQLLCLFSSTLEFNNLFCSFKGEGTGAVRHMFSNHILKPERTPLENSIWGTDKSSGTFKTLFESRLIRAKRYLDEPFEIVLNQDIFGKPAPSSKTIASKPIHIPVLDSWPETRSHAQWALILNGNSAKLAIPDLSVDAVVTDPPYFDFVHYSELSDFFFAWLSPVLKSRYLYFDKSDSAAKGEVQHKNPLHFALQLSHVFTECHRILKNDGVLAFSFHHSREEGWAAIYEAIRTAGFEVVAAHPVHAEFRGASPKNAAKDPISLDAILVCCKQTQAKAKIFDLDLVVEKTISLAEQLTSGGMRISSSDRFVIAASQTLISASAEHLSFEEIKLRLEEVRTHLGSITELKTATSSEQLVTCATAAD